MLLRLPALAALRLPLARLLVGCALAAPALAPARAGEPLRIAVSRAPLSTPLYVAEARGFFAAEGVEVKLSDCLGGHRCLAAMLRGESDLATATELPVLLTAFQRADHAILATFVTTANDVKLVARRASGVATTRQLAGKRIGLVMGTSSQYFLDLTLLAEGVDPRDIAFVGLQPEQLVESLRTGLVDAIASWEPYAWQTLQALDGGALVLASAGGYVETFNLVGLRKVDAAGRDARVRALRAIERAQQFIEQQPEEAKAIVRRRLQIEPALVDWVWPGMAFRLTLGQSLIATMESQARWAQREGHVSGRTRPNALELVDTAALKAAKPAAVGIAR